MRRAAIDILSEFAPEALPMLRDLGLSLVRSFETPIDLGPAVRLLYEDADHKVLPQACEDEHWLVSVVVGTDRNKPIVQEVSLVERLD